MRAVHDILIVRNNSMLARCIKPDVHLNVRDIESIHKAKEYAEIRLYFFGPGNWNCPCGFQGLCWKPPRAGGKLPCLFVARTKSSHSCCYSSSRWGNCPMIVISVSGTLATTISILKMLHSTLTMLTNIIPRLSRWILLRLLTGRVVILCFWL